MQASQITKVYAPDNVYAYLMCDTELDSDTAGQCDQCGGDVLRLNLQVELVQQLGRGGSKWQTTKMSTGHLKCLRRARREGGKTTELKSLTVGEITWTVS